MFGLIKKATTSSRVKMHRMRSQLSSLFSSFSGPYESFSLDDASRVINAGETMMMNERFFVGNHEKSGRGMYATREMKRGEKIFDEAQKPIISHPTRWNYESKCYFCSGEKEKKEGSRFCGDACEEDAEKSFYAAERTMDLEKIEKYCEEHELKFPLMALRIATKGVQKSLGLNAESAANEKASVQFMVTRSMRRRLTEEMNFSEEEVNQMTPEEAARKIREKGKDGKEDSSNVLDWKTLRKCANVAKMLVHAHVDESQMFPSWKEEHALLLQTLESCEHVRDNESEKEKIRSVFDVRWYADLTTRFHLNSFKIEYPIGGVNSGDFRAMMEQTLASSIRTSASNGSAIYGIASMFNHSCAPNVNVVWPERNHLVEFIANENVKQGEQLTIAYIDLNEDRSLDVAKRRAQLEEAYGFVCECPRCASETQS